jgi:probable F420-dependent oxidoreductase
VKVRVGFGLGVASGSAVDGAALWSIVDACESQGWDSLWFSERIAGGLPDVLALMAAVAGRTRRLKFGPSVLVVPGRNPVLLAKELATIDVLSGGRLVPAFGLGSDAAREHEAFGIERSERAGRTDEAVALMKRLWTEDHVTHEGRYFTVHDLTVGPRPVQTPSMDVWFGGHSPAALRRVGRLGDGWLPSFVTAAEYRAKADEVRKVAADNGRHVDDEHYGALVGYLPDGVEPPEQLLRLLAATRKDPVDPRDIVASGGPAGLRRRLEEFIAQGASKFVVLPLVPPADWVGELATLRDQVAVPLEN